MIKLLQLIKEIIYKDLIESIHPKEASYDNDAIQTVVDGKRNLGAITIDTSQYRGTARYFFKRMKDLGLNILHVPSNPYTLYIYYRDGAEEEAEELRDIAEKHGGYFAWWATDEDTRRIGKLLGYNDSAVEVFISTTDQEKARQMRIKQGLE